MSIEDMNRKAFMEEAQDLLAELETGLLELEEQPDDSDCIDRVFRCMHTIKGSGAMFGFDDIAAFTHDVENVFDLVRNNAMAVSKELLDLTLSSRDHIVYLLECAKSDAPVDLERSRELTTKLKALAAGADQAEDAQPAEEESSGDYDTQAPDQDVTYRVRFKPNTEIFRYGANPAALVEELTAMGASMAFVHLEDLPGLEELDPESCHVWWDVVLTTNAGPEAIREVFMFVEDDCDLSIKVVDRGTGLDDDTSYKRIGEILLERGDLNPEDLEKVLSEQKQLGELLTDAGLVKKQAVESALAEQNAVRKIRESRSAPAVEAATSIRVAADKLDYLVDLVGELVIVQAQISQVVHEQNDPSMVLLAEELERLSDDLRDSTLGIRMLPIGTTFSKFRRLVRDLSSDLGKEIELVTRGAETELDKTVIERLGDPLVHLLRNSIDHGIETPDERTANGKKGAGEILLSAEHSGGDVLIQIRDDGKGMDPEVIRAKGVERGLISPEAELTDKEIFGLIFQPGFSTAQSVTSVSGRGVGMDVVKRSIDSLRGSVDIDSALGLGTTITVKLPLTLAIIDGLQICVENEYYVIPLSLVEECVELLAKEEEGGKEQRIINLRGEIVPYLRLREFFALDGKAPPIEQVVVVGVQGGRMGIVVDNVIGEHQTVIKSLGRVYRDVEGISGATIKGDGTMALILDVPKLLQLAAG
ncbi:MAG: chemotaxis protein CheA [Desulfovibrio sp.]|nr:MAG: chemotaxis protein CheA [Desulfovibrio sp.]